MPVQYVTFCTLDELPAGSREVFDLERGSIILFNVDGDIYAVENMCSHEEYELHDGVLSDCTLECPKHGASFDLRTGEARSAPAYNPVKIFPVRIEGREIQVALELD